MPDALPTSPSIQAPAPEAADPYARRPDESHRQWFDRVWEMSQKRKQPESETPNFRNSVPS